MKYLLLFLVLLLGCISVFSCWTTLTEHEKVTLNQTTKYNSLRIINPFNGWIKVTSNQSPPDSREHNIKINAYKHASSKDVLSSISIICEEKESYYLITVSSSQTKNLVVDFELNLPSFFSLYLETNNGEIHAKDISNSLIAKTSNASISLNNITGDIITESSNGNLKIDNMIGSLEAKCSNGEINVHLQLPEMSHCIINNSNGDVNVYLPKKASANIEASTSNGNVITNLELSNSTIKNDYLVGILNAGKGKVSLKSSNGSIRILSY